MAVMAEYTEIHSCPDALCDRQGGCEHLGLHMSLHLRICRGKDRVWRHAILCLFDHGDREVQEWMRQQFAVDSAQNHVNLRSQMSRAYKSDG